MSLGRDLRSLSILAAFGGACTASSEVDPTGNATDEGTSTGEPSVGTTATKDPPTGSSSGSETSSSSSEVSSTGEGPDESSSGGELVDPIEGPGVVDLPIGDRTLDSFCEVEVPRADGSMEAYVLWRPGGIEHLRGLLLGSQTNPVRQETARLHNLGVLGFDGTGVSQGEGWEEDFLAALEAVGDACEHPELADAVFLGTGYSATSGAGARLVEAFPQRAIGYVPGGLEAAPRSDATRAIPWLTYYGGADGVQPTVQLEALAAGRAEGARYGLAPMWGVGHSINRGINLLLPTFHQFLARRYPDHLDARNGVPVLVPFEEADGWLASMESFAEYRHDGPAVPMLVARASEYPGDASTASWMIDAFVAHAWQAFVAHRQTPVRIVSPQGHQHPAPENPMTFVEEGAGLDVQVEVVTDIGTAPKAVLTSVVLRSGDLVLGEIVGPGSVQVVFEGVVLPVAGAHPLIAEVNYDDGQQRVSHPVTVQVVRAGCPSPDAGYQVICVAQ